MYKPTEDGAGISWVSRRSAAGRVGERARFGEKGFPLQSPPLLEKHRPDACAMEEMGQKGIELKAMIRIWRGAAGCQVWKSVTFSRAFSMFSEYSQVFPSMP